MTNVVLYSRYCRRVGDVRPIDPTLFRRAVCCHEEIWKYPTFAEDVTLLHENNVYRFYRSELVSISAVASYMPLTLLLPQEKYVDSFSLFGVEFHVLWR